MRFLNHAAAVTRLLTATLLMTVTAGCGAAPFAPSHVDVSFRAVFRGDGMKVQAVATPYTVADVAHLYLRVYQVIGTAPNELEVPLVTGLDTPVVLHIARNGATYVNAQSVVLSGLQRASHYRVRAFAYTDGDVDNPISVDGPGSLTDLLLSQAGTATVVQSSVQVQLADRTFNGQAHSATVTVTPGVLTGVPYTPTL
jgi:hypothetical protein